MNLTAWGNIDIIQALRRAHCAAAPAAAGAAKPLADAGTGAAKSLADVVSLLGAKAAATEGVLGKEEQED